MRKIHRWGWEGVPSEKIRERADRPPKQKAINTVLEVIYGHLQEKSVSTGQDDAKEEQPMHPARLESFPFWARGNFYRERFRWEREAYDSLRAFLSLFSSSSSPSAMVIWKGELHSGYVEVNWNHTEHIWYISEAWRTSLTLTASRP